jgi:hypothetical protein
MRNLLTYEQFNEQYLPYFGSKQALDDSRKPLLSEKMSDFHRIYSMTPTWWTAWRKENADKYEYKQDAFSKTYEVSKDGKILFVFDYGRNKIFTNETPELFTIKQDVSPEELEKIKDVDVEDPTSKPDDAPKGKETKKEEEAEGEVATDKVEAEEE